MTLTSAQGGWREERRARLLAAAAQVFGRSTFAAASMDEIARVAGVGKPTLYRYFASKEDLFAAVFERALDALDERLGEALATDRALAPTLKAMVTAMVPIFRDHLVALRFLGADAAAIDQSQRRIFRERRERIAGAIGKALTRAAARGELRPDAQPDIAAHLIIGALWSATSRVRGSDADIADAVATFALHGICVADPGAVAAGASRDVSTIFQARSADLAPPEAA